MINLIFKKKDQFIKLSNINKLIKKVWIFFIYFSNFLLKLRSFLL